MAADPACRLKPARWLVDEATGTFKMALVAAREALAAAGVSPEKCGRRMGLIFSTCSGPMLLIEAHYERIIAASRGSRRKNFLPNVITPARRFWRRPRHRAAFAPRS